MILQEVGTSFFSRKTYDEYQEEDKAGTLVAMEYNREPTNIAVSVGNGQLHQIGMEPIARPLDCMHDQQMVLTDGKPPRKYIVRRLTPLECCRLQGFPDWWCEGVEGSDSAQYRMWGNGIALPCAFDVLERIARAGGNNDPSDL